MRIWAKTITEGIDRKEWIENVKELELSLESLGGGCAIIRIGDNMKSVMEKLIYEVLTGQVGRNLQKIVRNLNLVLMEEVLSWRNILVT